ncbi:three-Cys-motif partner protein TcmP [Atrimonas thermophila]|uniref:three-Cys-motif partner protein TcmP n=1 Tax=Atrimonas thermophila TaxID=3064161 RepID=UPI00399D1D9A
MVGNDLWDLSNRPATQMKLKILKKVFEVWLTIWNKQNWASNEWYVIDLFAGKGKYNDGSSGSPLIFLDAINTKAELLRTDLEIKLFLVEKNRNNYHALKVHIDDFLNQNKELKKSVKLFYFNKDANSAINDIIKQIKNTPKNPLFVLIDPTGIQLKKENLKKILELKNRKDILYNYILEGVRRTGGVARKALEGKSLTHREIKTVETFIEFMGEDIDFVKKDDVELMKSYCQIFTSDNMEVVAYDLPYSNRNDVLYYLLFASKKSNITKIVKDIYAREKERQRGKTLFGGKEFYKNALITFSQEIECITRKSLLYKTKVEYGDWTINHIVGCKHGCRFPCYAMMMARKFGWIKDYEDWRKPKLVKNALDLLEKEIPKYKNQIDFVHLCFMTDPFMYDAEKDRIIPEIKDLTLKIIERLNRDGIRVTILTKGIYPEDLLNTQRFSKNNEYGITLVSFNKKFKEQYEPYSSLYETRVESLKKLAKAGLKTWVSIEPYPTPELDPDAAQIEKILEKIHFAKKIIFGKLNYNKLVNYCGRNSHNWKNSQEFYEAIARKVIDFCNTNNIQYHIKAGTPLSNESHRNIFK